MWQVAPYYETSDRHVDCSTCGGDLHFGPAVAAIGNPVDLSLSDAAVSQLAWYHTSTTDNWPLLQRPPLEVDQHFARLMPAAALDRAREHHADQALHLGTAREEQWNEIRRWWWRRGVGGCP
jgi:hypothetical protein